MSGICGIVAFDGRRPTLGPILEKLERRGPDATRSWSEGPVALGQTLLATTPEALTEILPLTDKASDCTITADVRLDNREILIAALGLDGETRTIGDGELILRAYLQWGEECPKHLLGDFAFAIWDRRHQRLFCARDHMGMKQLIYHHAPGETFAFATDAEALVAHPDVPRAINEARIADFLDDLEGADFTSTFYKQIDRLAPAHRLSVDAQRYALSRYWSLDRGETLLLDSDEPYAAAFLKIFSAAVECRLRGPAAIGSMLSGGLDSNAVAAVAADLLAGQGRGLLPTFSAVHSDSIGCVETTAILRAMKNKQFEPHLVRSNDEASTAAEIDRLTSQCLEPFDGQMVMIAAVYRLAQANGIRVMLDGVAADVVLTAGNRVAGLLRQGNLAGAVREARREQQFWGPAWPVRTILASAAWGALVPAWLRQIRRRLIWAVEDRKLERGDDTLSAALARSVDMRARRRTFRGHRSFASLTSTDYRRGSLLHPHLVVARERYDRVAATFGIEPRDPFMDIRLIAFCLSLPPAQLQADGWPKAVLRRAMAGHLPHDIAWKPGKAHLGAAFTKPVFDKWLLSRDDLAADRSITPRWGDALRSEALEGVDRESWFKLTILSKWLSRRLPGDRASQPRK